MIFRPARVTQGGAILLALSISGTAMPGDTALLPAFLAGNVRYAVPICSERLLCVDGSGTFFTVDPLSGEQEPWVLSWAPQDDGWEVLGHPCDLTSSQDGRYVSFALSVLLPWNLKTPRGWNGMRDPTLFVLAESDGSGARPAAIGVAVGSGPRIAFTSDSRFLIGTGLEPCEPTPEGYSRFVMGLDQAAPSGGMDVESGEHLATVGTAIPSDFWRCPWSDWAICPDENGLVGFASLAGEIADTTAYYPTDLHLEGWVLPDALLWSAATSGDNCQGIVFAGGAGNVFYEVPPGIWWDVYGWLPDGRYLYTFDNGNSVRLGAVDWPAFDADSACTIVSMDAADFVRMRTVPVPGLGFAFTDAYGPGDLLFLRAP